MAATTAVNYEDPRFSQVESDKKQAMTELEQTYGGMIGESDKYYQAQIDATKDWANTQQQLQQEQTDFTIEKVEQQKQQAQKDYIKEQSGAYVDWRKQSNEYGSEAEKMASAGLAATGYSESSQVSMYNTYQNRVSVARESYNNAVLNYNNAIKEAQLQNNSALAEIAYEALQTQLQLSLEGFQYKNNLILEQANNKVELDNEYYDRYLSVLDQINTENALAEQQRQFDATYTLQQKEFEEQIRQFNQNYNLQLKEFNEEVRQYNQTYNENVRQFNEEIARLKKKDEQEYALEIKQLELQKQQLAEQKRQHDAEMAVKEKQLAEEKRQFDQQMAYQKQQAAKSYSSSSSSSGGSSSTKKSSTSSKTKSTSSSSVTKASTGGSVNGNKQKVSSNYAAASNYISKLISSGATKNKVIAVIAVAQNKGELSSSEAAALRARYVPKGQQYT